VIENKEKLKLQLTIGRFVWYIYSRIADSGYRLIRYNSQPIISDNNRLHRKDRKMKTQKNKTKVLDQIAMDEIYIQMKKCETLARPKRLRAIKYHDKELDCTRVGMTYCEREIFSITADNMLILNVSAVDSRQYEIERYLKVLSQAPETISQGRDNVVIALDTQYNKSNDMTQSTQRFVNSLLRAFNVNLSLVTDTRDRWIVQRWIDNGWKEIDTITRDNMVKIYNLSEL